MAVATTATMLAPLAAPSARAAGTCCFGDGTCAVVVNANLCNGSYLGDGTENLCQFGHNPCAGPGRGVCCINGGCILRGGPECASYGGTYFGDGTQCLPVQFCGPPIPWACCLRNQACMDLSPGYCSDISASPDPAGQPCAGVSCPPYRACCYTNGGCIDATPPACITFAGTPQGAGTVCGPNVNCTPLAVKINEIRIDQPTVSHKLELADQDEYFELYGPPNTSLNGYWYIVIGNGRPAVGDVGRNCGVVEEAIDLTGQSIPASGFFLAAELHYGESLGFVPAAPNLRRDLNFENRHNLTHLLVKSFVGSIGQDLDADDNGALDSQPWTSIDDCLAVVGAPYPKNDKTYCATTVGPKIFANKNYVPAHVRRSTNGGGTWQIGSFEFTASSDDTPGSTNTPAPGACCIDSKCEMKANPWLCAAAGGQWAGSESECPPESCDTPCPSPCVGACCTGTSCSMLTQAACGNNWFRGAGTTCSNVNCDCDRRVRLNEVSCGDPAIDTREFIELFTPICVGVGTPHTLAGLSLLLVDGDTDGDPTSWNFQRIIYRKDLLLADTIVEGGCFVCGTTPGANAPFPLGTLENHSQTFALVRTQDIAVCTDPGNPSVPPAGCDGRVNSHRLTDGSAAAITANKFDAVATLDINAGDAAYFNAPVVKSGMFQASYMQRKIDGVGTTAADWDTQWNQTTGGVDDTATPGMHNVVPTGSCCTASGCTAGVTRSNCENTLSGTYNGNGSSCSPNPCVGVCCAGVGGTCTANQTPQQCAAALGIFMGKGSTCTGNICGGKNIFQAKALPTGSPVIVSTLIVISIDDVHGHPDWKAIQCRRSTAGLSIVARNTVLDSLGIGMGNSIDLAGTTDSWNGLFELVDGNCPLKVINHGGSSGAAVQILTAADLQDGNANAEANESRVVRVNCLVFRDAGQGLSFEGDTTYLATDGTQWVRIGVPASATTLIGQPIPGGAHDLQGILWQSDFTAPTDTPPDNSGYRIVLRKLTDILSPTCAEPTNTACCLPNGTCQCVNMQAALCTAIGGTTPLGAGIPCSSGSATLCRGGHLVGDMDCDGSRNNFDIDVFILALLDPVAYSQANPFCSYLNGDMNCDGFLNNFDIDAFVDCLLHGCS